MIGRGFFLLRNYNLYCITKRPLITTLVPTLTTKQLLEKTPLYSNVMFNKFQHQNSQAKEPLMKYNKNIKKEADNKVDVNIKLESDIEHLNEKVMAEKIVEPEMLTLKEKLKKAVKEYGSIVIIFHVGISLLSLGTCYLLVSSGLDVMKILDYLGFQNVSTTGIATSAGTFAISYAVHKVFAPVRITITLVSVPLIVRHLRKIGFLKKV